METDWYLCKVGNVITALFTSVIRPKDKKPSAGLYKYVMLTALRTLVRRTSVRQQQYFPPSLPSPIFLELEEG
jgi:hypothetical protein